MGMKRAPKASRPSTNAIGVRAGDVIDRLKMVAHAKSDAALAAYLGTSKRTISSWRTRNSIPIDECLRVALDKGVGLDWLLLGKGTEHVVTPYLRTEGGPIDVALLQICMFEVLSELLFELLPEAIRSTDERWVFARTLSNRLAGEYDRYLRMERPTVGLVPADHTTFLQALRKLVEERADDFINSHKLLRQEAEKTRTSKARKKGSQ